VELFDSVADNLIENALKKSTESVGLSVRVIFSAVGRGTLTVSDNGRAVSRSAAQDLFSAPVHSQTGFGVGLYQSSRLAADFGYTLSLATNEIGNVSFVLASQHSARDGLRTTRVA
jgi:C4-dicarboxylate-specific signal transduction histidine kinase